jgi:DNA-binding response OmpR family regulator
MLFGKKKRAIRTILIVEDEPLVAFDNEHFLAAAGYKIVATVDRVDHAVATLEAHEIDLVLADVNLSSGGDGIDVARTAHARETAVLFVTGACPIEAQRLAVGCLAKPYAQRDLLDAIEAVDQMLQGAKPGRVPAGLSLYIGAKG